MSTCWFTVPPSPYFGHLKAKKKYIGLKIHIRPFWWFLWFWWCYSPMLTSSSLTKLVNDNGVCKAVSGFAPGLLIIKWSYGQMLLQSIWIWMRIQEIHSVKKIYLHMNYLDLYNNFRGNHGVWSKLNFCKFIRCYILSNKFSAVSGFLFSGLKIYTILSGALLVQRNNTILFYSWNITSPPSLKIIHTARDW